MPPYRSHRTTQGRTQMAARALWRATGTAEADLAKLIVAIANSYTQFVPGHVHLKPRGDLVAQEIYKAGDRNPRDNRWLTVGSTRDLEILGHKAITRAKRWEAADEGEDAQDE